MDELVRLNCDELTKQLASSAPSPGGGAAAALAGALAASLCAMAGAVTRENPRYAERAGALAALCGRAEELRGRLLRQMDEDAALFAPLAAAYRIPRSEPGRAEILRGATLTACRAPMAMLRLAAELAGLLEQMLPLSGPMLRSDVGCGAILCRAAMEAAAVNVRVNTRTLPEDGQARALDAEAEALLADCLPRLQAVADAVRESLR